MAIAKPNIVVAKDHIVICGQIVKRPPTISPSQWYWFWEWVAIKANN